ncbi:hypothetical protein [Rhodoferax sp.]|nr:hypothetical protein [Rhodoferax sp.]
MEHAPNWLVNSFIRLSAAVITVQRCRMPGPDAIIGCLDAGIAMHPTRQA